MVRSFELCAQAGADLLSIESTGGKEVHDDALLNGDLSAGGVRPGHPGQPGHGLPVGHDRGRGAPARRRGRGRHRLRLWQHGHDAGRHQAHPQGVGGHDPGDDRGAQPGGLRAGRRRAGQGLRATRTSTSRRSPAIPWPWKGRRRPVPISRRSATSPRPLPTCGATSRCRTSSCWAAWRRPSRSSSWPMPRG